MHVPPSSTGGPAEFATTADGEDEVWQTPGLTLEEVRVLTGLSRGAAIPIESVLQVGSDPECDLVLLDPLVAPHEAHLERPVAAGGPLTVKWLNPGSEEAHETVPGEHVIRTAEVELGDVFLVSGVFLQYCNSDAPWDYALLPKTVAPALPVSSVAARRRPWHRRPRLLFLVATVVLVIAALVATAVLYFQRQDQEIAAVRARRATALQAQAPTVAQVARKLQLEFEGRGLSMVKIDVRRDIVQISGTVPGERQEEFESVVERARALHRRVKFRIDSAVDSFVGPAVDIVAIAGGIAPNVLLSDGQQLFVGSDVQGFRLTAIEGACAVFKVIDAQTKVSRCLVSEKKP